MKLLLKIFLPILFIVAFVFIAANYFSVAVFKDVFLENKALVFGDHALREIRESFSDEDLKKDFLDGTSSAKFKKFAKAIEDPSVFRVNIWNRKYEVVYSDLKQLMGKQQGDEHIKKGFDGNLPISWSINEPDIGSTDAGFGSFIDMVIPIRDSSGEIRYLLEAHAATSAILNIMQNSINKSFYFLLGGGIIIFVLIYLIISILVIKPINKLRKAMDIVGAGDLAYEVKSGSKDEIGEIYNHFDTMRLQLKDILEQIEKKVEERTRDLSISRDEVTKGWLQIQKEKARLTASINSLALGFVMTDIEGDVVVSNAALEKIFDLESNNWGIADIQKKLQDNFDFLKHCKICIKERKVVDVKDVGYGAKYLKIFMSPIITKEKEVIGTVILAEDITEAKIMERSKDEFFSIASHELRTPLTSIKGNTSLIKQYYADTLKDADLKDMINDIHESSVRLIEIVNDFLDTSRLEQGKMVFKKEDVDLSKIIEQVVYEIEAIAKEKNIYVKFAPLTLSVKPNVIADSDKIKQIVYNLIGNAMKFTEKGGVTINLLKDKDFFKVTVTDTGRGISAQNQNLLFRKFQQANSSILTRDTTKGTGLGLYISKMMVEAMGGKISLEKSEEGKGTTFAFTLPVNKSNDVLPAPKTVEEPTKVDATPPKEEEVKKEVPLENIKKENSV